MATPTTTFDAIRAQQITLVKALAPVLASDVAFDCEPITGPFEEWAEANADRVFRRFTIRLTESEVSPDFARDTQTDFVTAQAELLVAYPAQPLGEFGPEELFDLDDCLASDYEQIRRAIGHLGTADYLEAQRACNVEAFDVIATDAVVYLMVPLEVTYYATASNNSFA